MERHQQSNDASSTTSRVDPSSVLVWIDAVYNDLPARIVRGLALADAFRSAGIESVMLSSIQSNNLPAETEKRNIHWIDSRPEGYPVTFNEIVKSARPDIIIADCYTPPRLAPELSPSLFALLSDAFSTRLFSVKRINTVLLPGFILPPSFESIRLLPSRLADCIHGIHYVPFLPEYLGKNMEQGTKNSQSALIAASGNVAPDAMAPLVDSIRAAGTETITLLADVPPNTVDNLKPHLPSITEWLIDPPLKKRIASIQNASMALAYPGLNVYELLALRKPLILLPRNEQENRVCQLALDQGVARVVSADSSCDELSSSMRSLWNNPDPRNELRSQQARLFPQNGATRLVDVLLNRYRQVCREPVSSLAAQ